MNKMAIHERQMQFVDAVNNAAGQMEQWFASGQLSGFRDGLRAAGIEVDLVACDLSQFERGFANRRMCGGVFLDHNPK